MINLVRAEGTRPAENLSKQSAARIDKRGKEWRDFKREINWKVS